MWGICQLSNTFQNFTRYYIMIISLNCRYDNGTWKVTAWSPVGKEFNIVFRNYADDLSFA